MRGVSAVVALSERAVGDLGAAASTNDDEERPTVAVNQEQRQARSHVKEVRAEPMVMRLRPCTPSLAAGDMVREARTRHTTARNMPRRSSKGRDGRVAEHLLHERVAPPLGRQVDEARGVLLPLVLGLQVALQGAGGDEKRAGRRGRRRDVK